ncbi:hypothetical protein [Microbulbifer hydrolyticus]|uniref:Uncharacterized protein n=1 Tax=Microbulbifer hydrolyticus TaxID=48074 RepID=A0A6P1T6A3_9GAMM|nr:hypothetical protein [Microbulbifer hydrolyticus]MBB5212866.1 hypothetical protein [Microbulbifer hydrolyticus]QHQ38344.1 hypothetical protein GTQ55_04605 [Microbulbifer hydrolyticus]
MSLRSLNRQIEQCRQDLDLQRRSTVSLLEQQRVQALAQTQKIPLPVAMGVAFASGFILQRFFNTPAPHTLLNWYLALRAF